METQLKGEHPIYKQKSSNSITKSASNCLSKNTGQKIVTRNTQNFHLPINHSIQQALKLEETTQFY